MSNFKLWIFWDLPVRAKRGEMKGPRGCLRVSSWSNHSTMEECRAELAAYVAAREGYGSFVKAEVYDLTEWTAGCLTARPVASLIP